VGGRLLDKEISPRVASTNRVSRLAYASSIRQFDEQNTGNLAVRSGFRTGLVSTEDSGN